jgi:hypothetical protein
MALWLEDMLHDESVAGFEADAGTMAGECLNDMGSLEQ